MVKVQIKFHQIFIFLVHKKKENFVLVQITHLITIVYLQKRICQPDIKFYLCINILRDIPKQKKYCCKCIFDSLGRQCWNFADIGRLRGILNRMANFASEKYIYIYIFLHKFRCYWFICYCFIFSDECGYLRNMIFGHRNKTLLYNFVVQFLFINGIEILCIR